MPTLATVVVHGAVTARNNYQYQFTPKHHGTDKKAAQWQPSLTLDEEFAVFNEADQHNLADAVGNLYGTERIGTDDLRILGTRGEQVAKFPVTAHNQAWHGYPAWPLAPSNRAGDDMKPTKAVLDQMQAHGIITKRGRKAPGEGRACMNGAPFNGVTPHPFFTQLKFEGFDVSCVAPNPPRSGVQLRLRRWQGETHGRIRQAIARHDRESIWRVHQRDCQFWQVHRSVLATGSYAAYLGQGSTPAARRLRCSPRCPRDRRNCTEGIMSLRSGEQES